MYENKECENILFLLKYLTTMYTLAYKILIILFNSYYLYTVKSVNASAGSSLSVWPLGGSTQRGVT